MIRTKLALAGWMFAGLTLAASPALAQAFPEGAGWLPLTKNGVPVGDPIGDSQNSRDIVGDAANPAVYVASDGANLFFRLRIDATVLQAPGEYKPFGWACLLDTDGDLQAYEYSAGVDGIANPDVVELRRNDPQASPNDPKDVAEILLASYSPDTHAREVPAPSAFADTPDFFIDWAVDTADLVAAGVGPETKIIFICGTSNNAQSLAADLITETGGTTLVDLQTDPVTCDELGCESPECEGAGEACAAGVGECLAVGITVCNGDQPVCSAVAGEPEAEVCDGKDNDCDGVTDNDCPPCDEDADCGDPKSGVVCNTDTSTCMEGCRPSGNGCPDGEKCTSVSEEIGECVGVDVKCDDDPDCGGPASGRICDTAQGVCVDGCRGEGNGCPETLVCSSTDGTFGTCEPEKSIIASGSGLFAFCGVGRAGGGDGGGRAGWALAAVVAAAALGARRRSRG